MSEYRNQLKMLFRVFIFLIGLPLYLMGQADQSVARKWNEALLDAIRTCS